MSHYYGKYCRIFQFKVVEVVPEDLDEDSLYQKYAVKSDSNKNNLAIGGLVTNERSSSICAELSVINSVT